MDNFKVDGGKNEESLKKIYNQNDKAMILATCHIQGTRPKLISATLSNKVRKKISEIECWKQGINTFKRVVGGGENLPSKTRDLSHKLKLE